jgi:phosphoglycerate kinase
VTRLPTLNATELAGRRYAGRRVLVRADLNVPLDGGAVTDDFRIRSSLPTIQMLRRGGARVIVCSHLGRPKGPDPAFSMRPVANRLAELGGFPVITAEAVIGPAAEHAVASARETEVVVLENTRFEPGETTNDPVVVDGLAELAEMFVLDAFGSAHRAHASTVGITERLPSAAGPLLEAEVEALGRLLGDPDRPYVVILGGAKISDKLAVMKHLLPRVDAMLVGGGMCFTLLRAQGLEVGASLVEEAMVAEVGALLSGPDGGKIVLPVDIVVADSFAADAPHRTAPASEMPAGGGMGLDIGPDSVARFASEIGPAGSVFWNGPMGVFEWEAFRPGTEGVAGAVAACGGFTVVGGGDSVAAIRMLGVEDRIGHVSTGGGAGLEMLEGKELPGVTALRRWADDA